MLKISDYANLFHAVSLDMKYLLAMSSSPEVLIQAAVVITPDLRVRAATLPSMPARFARPPLGVCSSDRIQQFNIKANIGARPCSLVA